MCSKTFVFFLHRLLTKMVEIEELMAVRSAFPRDASPRSPEAVPKPLRPYQLAVS